MLSAQGPSQQGECGLLKVTFPDRGGHLAGQATKPPARFEVTCDGDGIAGHARSALLVQLADRLGLTTALGWRAGRTQTSRHRHPAGAVLRDLGEVVEPAAR